MSDYRLGRFTVDLDQRVLRFNGDRVDLGFRNFDIFRVLIQAEGRVVERESFHQQLWPGAVVDDSTLSKHVSQLRKTLAEHDPDTQYVETAPRLGYRLAVPVEPAQGPPAPEPPPSRFWTASRKAAAGIMLAAVLGGAGWSAWRLQGRSQAADGMVSTARQYARDGDHAKAAAELRRAIAVDPSRAEAYNELAWALHKMGDAEVRPVLSLEAARKGVEADPDCAPCRGTLGFFLFYHAWDWKGAETQYDEALRIEPDNRGIRVSHAYLLAATGRITEGLAQISAAVNQAPFEANGHAVQSALFYVARQYEQAIAAADRAVAIRRDRAEAWDYRSRAQFQLGRLEEGVRSAITWRYRDSAAEVGQALDQGGAAAGLRKLLEITGGYPERRRVAFRRAIWWAVLGEDDKVLEELEAQVKLRNVNLMLVAVDPAYAHLHAHPRFKAILETMGLEDAPGRAGQESSRR